LLDRLLHGGGDVEHVIEVSALAGFDPPARTTGDGLQRGGVYRSARRRHPLVEQRHAAFDCALEIIAQRRLWCIRQRSLGCLLRTATGGFALRVGWRRQCRCHQNQ
jgi:hypothetical protein